MVICPVDGRPCAPDCPDRFYDRPDGGCLMTELQAHGASVLLISPLQKPGHKTPPADRAQDDAAG